MLVCDSCLFQFEQIIDFIDIEQKRVRESALCCATHSNQLTNRLPSQFISEKEEKTKQENDLFQ